MVAVPNGKRLPRLRRVGARFEEKKVAEVLRPRPLGRAAVAARARGHRGVRPRGAAKDTSE